MGDLLSAVNRGRKRDKRSADEANLDVMSVNDLRKKLYKRGMDIDGSRETMIVALRGVPQGKEES